MQTLQFHSIPGGLFFPSALAVTFLRFYGLPPFRSDSKGVNKYVLWGAVVVGQMYVMAVHNRYTTVVI